MMLRVEWKDDLGKVRHGTVVSWHTSPSSDSWATIVGDDGRIMDGKIGSLKGIGWRSDIPLFGKEDAV